MSKPRLYANNSATSVPVSIREASALALCRSVLEEVEGDYKERLTIAPSGEIITFDSAVEIFDDVMLTRIK